MIAIDKTNTRNGRADHAQNEDGARATQNRTSGRSAESTRSNSNTSKALLFGLDWGTNKSCLYYTDASTSSEVTHIVPTVVGYAQDGVVENLLPGEARVLFGQQALQHRLHLKVVAPMKKGVIADVRAARDFTLHLKSLLNLADGVEARAVIGMPANADAGAREDMRQTVAGVFDRVILIPEPFLAALGVREESRLSEADYIDPVRNSLFVDIGGGTTDICLVQGYYPTPEDQISLAFAGDRVEELLNEEILKTYPDCQLSAHTIRTLKEKFSFVGETAEPVIASVMVNGKPRKLDITEQVRSACTSLLMEIFESVKTLIARASSDSVEELLTNIILTGGGSCIRNLDTELQRLLTEEGYGEPRVRKAGEKFKEFVARGAYKAARQAREDQWQRILS